MDLAKYQKQTFGRTYTTDVYKPQEGLVAITRMHDSYHDMQLAILVDKKSLTIRKIAAKMDRHPYPLCQAAVLKLQGLVGLFIFEKGILRHVKVTIPKSEGCTHLYELVETTLRSLFAAVSSIYGEKNVRGIELNLEERRQLGIQNPVLRNSCHVFNERGADQSVFDAAAKKLSIKDDPQPVY